MILGIEVLNTIERAQANLQEALMKTRTVLFKGMRSLIVQQFKARAKRLDHIALEKKALLADQEKLIEATIEYNKKVREIED